MQSQLSSYRNVTGLLEIFLRRSNGLRTLQPLFLSSPALLFQAMGPLYNSFIYCLQSQSQTLFGKLQAFSSHWLFLVRLLFFRVSLTLVQNKIIITSNVQQPVYSYTGKRVMRGEIADNVPGFYNSVEERRLKSCGFYSKQVLVRG